MSTLSNSDFAARVFEIAQPGEEFKPVAYYDRDGDCIEFIASQESFRAERIDNLVTVYYGRDSKQLVGSLIKGVSKFCGDFAQRNPGFAIEIQDGPVKLVHLLTAGLWSQDRSEGLRKIVYRKLIETADDIVVDGELCLSGE